MRTIETIVITAQKREQSLQDVPIVVTALSEQLLQDTGVRDIKDLMILTPGLLVSSTANDVRMSRGAWMRESGSHGER